MDLNKTYENYILFLLSETDKQLTKLYKEKSDYTLMDYRCRFERLHGERNTLMMLMTGHDNEQIKKKIKDHNDLRFNKIKEELLQIL